MPFVNVALPEGIELYIRPAWLFAGIITVLMLCLCYLYISMRRTEERGAQSLVFSHLAIKGLEMERWCVFRELHGTVLPLVKDAGWRLLSVLSAWN
jgi:hypothetical protein